MNTLSLLNIYGIINFVLLPGSSLFRLVFPFLILHTCLGVSASFNFFVLEWKWCDYLLKVIWSKESTSMSGIESDVRCLFSSMWKKKKKDLSCIICFIVMNWSRIWNLCLKFNYCVEKVLAVSLSIQLWEWIGELNAPFTICSLRYLK